MPIQTSQRLRNYCNQLAVSVLLLISANVNEAIFELAKLTTAFLLLFLKCGRKKTKRGTDTDTQTFPIWPQAYFIAKDVKIQDKALKLIMDKDSLGKVAYP